MSQQHERTTLAQWRALAAEGMADAFRELHRVSELRAAYRDDPRVPGIVRAGRSARATTALLALLREWGVSIAGFGAAAAGSRTAAEAHAARAQRELRAAALQAERGGASAADVRDWGQSEAARAALADQTLALARRAAAYADIAVGALLRRLLGALLLLAAALDATTPQTAASRAVESQPTGPVLVHTLAIAPGAPSLARHSLAARAA